MEYNWISSQWRQKERYGVWNHQTHDCFLKSLFRRRSKKTSKLRVAGLCAGNSPVIGEFPAQMASNAENASIQWRHRESCRAPQMHLLRLLIRGWCVHDRFSVQFVFQMEWRLRIADTEPSFDFKHTLCHKTRNGVVPAKTGYLETSFGEVEWTLWQWPVLNQIGVMCQSHSDRVVLPFWQVNNACTFSSLLTPGAIVMVTYGATSDDIVVVMTILIFQR